MFYKDGKKAEVGHEVIGAAPETKPAEGRVVGVHWNGKKVKSCKISLAHIDDKSVARLTEVNSADYIIKPADENEQSSPDTGTEASA